MSFITHGKLNSRSSTSPATVPAPTSITSFSTYPAVSVATFAVAYRRGADGGPGVLAALGPRSGTRRRRRPPSRTRHPLKNVSVVRRNGVADWTGAGSRIGSWRGIGMGFAGW